MVVFAPWEVTSAFSAASLSFSHAPADSCRAERRATCRPASRRVEVVTAPRHAPRAAGGRLGGGARLMNAIALPDKGDDFLSRRRAEVVGSASPIESGAPSFGEFCNAFGQPLDFAVVVR
jgi:hypothetical protein